MTAPADPPRPPATRVPSPQFAAEHPPRVRKLLAALCDLAVGRLEPLIAQAIEEFERDLFRIADQPRDSAEQQRCFETLREFRRHRAELSPRFFAALEEAIDRIGREPEPGSATIAARGELTLVSEAQMEMETAIAEAAGRAEVRASLPLYLLGQRLAVLAAAPAFDAARIPIGPRTLARLLISASKPIAMAEEHRALLLRHFERQFLPACAAFYEAANRLLVEDRILPHLGFVAGRRGPGPAPEAAPREVRGRSATVPRGAAGAQGAPGTVTPAPTVSPPPGVATGPFRMPPAVPAPSEESSRRGGPAPRPAAPAETPRAGVPWLGIPSPEAEHPHEREVFETVRELLAARRQLLDRFGGREAALGHPVSDTDLEEVLRQMQRRPLTPVYANGKLQVPGIQHLKQDLLAQLRSRVPEGRVPRLAEEHADTIDLVGMLFEQIMRELKPSGVSQLLLAKLQTPVLRTALKDRGFFTHRGHPARRLLNSIAETGMYWLDAEECDRELVDKMHHLVDRVTSDFEGDLALMEGLLEDLSGYMQTIAKRAEVAERRHVEAARGKERLELARERAASEIAARVRDRSLPPIVTQVLEQTWTDVLALTELRQGEDSPAYRRRLEIAERLIRASERGAPGAERALDDALRAEVEQGLALVGLTPADARSVTQALFSAAAERESGASPTELAVRLKTHGLGAREGGTPKREERPPNAEEKAMIERIKTLPFGTWVEFVVNQQGDRVRRRLSWFSPVTGRCLFVNQRGQKVDERTLVSFARELVRGNAKVIEERRESLIDRAWRGVLEALRQFAGRREAPQPEEAR